jgi:hypothetical protein
MAARVVLSAKPVDIQRPRVILMMAVSRSGSANLAWRPREPPLTNGQRHHRARRFLLRVALVILSGNRAEVTVFPCMSICLGARRAAGFTSRAGKFGPDFAMPTFADTSYPQPKFHLLSKYPRLVGFAWLWIN